jgi:hypothetical protein
MNSAVKKAPALIAKKESKKKIIVIADTLEVVEPDRVQEDLSLFEINNSGLIDLFAMSVEKMAFVKLSSINIEDTYLEDEVATAQASTELLPLESDEVKTTQPAPERKTAEVEEVANKNTEEEMVMFDYSEKAVPVAAEKTIDEKLYERPISNTVMKAISREMGPAPVRKLASEKIAKTTTTTNTKIEDLDIDLNSDENTTYDYSGNKNKTSIADAETAIAEKEAFTAPVTKTEQSQFIIRAKEINLNTQKKRQAASFEFVPDYDRAERSDDQGSGEIAFGYSLSGAMNTQTGVIQGQGMITTRVELNLDGKAIMEVPLINEDGMQKFLQKQGLSIEGNLITLAIDPSIIDTEIDSVFAERFYFDHNFKSITYAKGASFVMYAGVKSGNVMIRYLLNNKESAQKIVYVGDGEMYFEDPEFTQSSRETFTFTTRNLLGQKKKELIIDGDAISFFNTSNKARKKALNAYEIKIPSLVSGMRKYLEFKHLKDRIFVGSSSELASEKEIEIPSNDFISKVLETNQISSLKDRCVVQVNLSKDLREVRASGKNRSGEMFVETSFLDKDGNFSADNSELADKMFIVGDLEGQFNLKLDYTDGSTEFLKTFCSEGTYLVEQL